MRETIDDTKQVKNDTHNAVLQIHTSHVESNFRKQNPRQKAKQQQHSIYVLKEQNTKMNKQKA